MPKLSRDSVFSLDKYSVNGDYLGKRKKFDSSDAKRALADAKEYAGIKTKKDFKAHFKGKEAQWEDGGYAGFKRHLKDVEVVLKTNKIKVPQATQSSDAQAKTAKVPKSSKVPSKLKGIANKMRDKGKTGWVTINGMHINLGGE